MTRKLHYRGAVLALVLALLLAMPLAAGATGVYFEAPQQSDPEIFPYLPASVPIKSGKLAIVTATSYAPLHVAPQEDANAFQIATREYPMRYLGTEGEFYYVLTFENKAGYIKKSDAVRSSQQVSFPVYPAGAYPMGRELTPGTESTDEALGVTSYTPGTYRPDSELALVAKSYYVKPLKGKTAKVIISNDEAGKDVVKSFSFKGQAIIDAENGQYVTIQNAVAYNAQLAPASILKKYIAANADVYDPGKGWVYDPKSDYAVTDDALIVTFM